MADFVFVYVTNPSKEEALSLANDLLSEKLIACANLMPITSCYVWEGKTQNDDEVVMIAKTRSELFEKVRHRIEEKHPYDVPCITRIPVSANEAFFNWVVESTTPH